MKIEKLGIIGAGIIGSAVNNLFCKVFKEDLIVYDPYVEPFNTNKEEINNCEIVFVCVPTPHRKYDGLDMSIIESVIADFNPKIFVISSTMQPGTADKLSKKYNKRIVVNPEYFGETANHPLTNLSQQPFLILGGESEDVKEVINLYKKVYNANIKIRVVTAKEAEIIKMSENRAAAFKIAQCQELYDVCEAEGVDYNNIREAVYGDDPRFNLWWTFIYEEARGMNSKCIPKDIYGWHKWAKDNNIDPSLTRSLLEYNKKLLDEYNIEEL
jgi:UDPglucose 6-dehydrogenase